MTPCPCQGSHHVLTSFHYFLLDDSLDILSKSHHVCCYSLLESCLEDQLSFQLDFTMSSGQYHCGQLVVSIISIFCLTLSTLSESFQQERVFHVLSLKIFSQMHPLLTLLLCPFISPTFTSRSIWHLVYASQFQDTSNDNEFLSLFSSYNGLNLSLFLSISIHLNVTMRYGTYECSRSTPQAFPNKTLN